MSAIDVCYPVLDRRAAGAALETKKGSIHLQHDHPRPSSSGVRTRNAYRGGSKSGLARCANPQVNEGQVFMCICSEFDYIE